MVPPPNPLTLERATVVWATANGPVAASMLALVGAGPRSYGLTAPVAPSAATTVGPVRGAATAPDIAPSVVAVVATAVRAAARAATWRPRLRVRRVVGGAG